MYQDIDLWEKMEKTERFFVQHVLPEIMTGSSVSGNVDDEERLSSINRQ